ncbi:MAG: hypothetical protein L0K44_09670, partial [Yaniella sp.]|nr:hypothetical protein [Yaniella sp.]
MQEFATALVAYVQAHGQLHFDTKAVALDIDSGTVFTETGQLFHGDHVVLAVAAPTAHDLISTVTPVAQRPVLPQRPEFGAGVALVMMAVDLEALDAHPRGTGILVSPNVVDVAAKAATHVTAKWEWARASATKLNKQRHVVRLSYGRVTDPSDGSAPGYDTSDEDLRELAYNDLAKLFDVPKQQVLENVAAIASVRWREAMPLTTPQNA